MRHPLAGQTSRTAGTPALARLLKERREELGLCRRELARRVGITHSLISRMETGQQRVSLKTLERIAATVDLRLRIRLE